MSQNLQSSNNSKPSALLVRIDRIGDLVLTLPADQNPLLADYEIHWGLSQGLGFVAQNSSPPRRYSEWKKAFSWTQFFAFYKKVKEIRPKVSVSFHAPWWVNLCLFIAGVPVRIGVLSQWHSYLFLNRGVRQKRSQCLHHELEYNHLLVHEGLRAEGPARFPYLRLTAPPGARPPGLPLQYGIIHPGMSGSALNWPREHYKNLIEKVASELPIVITGTIGDRFILEPLRSELGDHSNIIWTNERLDSGQLLTTLAGATFVFAPSTGVIHLAASLGVPTFGIYSPIKVESAERWGPRGDCVKTFTPEHMIDQPGQALALVSPEEIYDSVKNSWRS